MSTTTTPYTCHIAGTLFMAHDIRDGNVAIEQPGQPALVLSRAESLELAAFLL